jgi:hypothetical protein
LISFNKEAVIKKRESGEFALIAAELGMPFVGLFV